MYYRFIFLVIVLASNCFASVVDTAWVRFNELEQMNNSMPTDQYVDGHGNVVVTGGVYFNQFFAPDGFMTVKYLPNGDTAWLRIFSSSNDSCVANLAKAVEGDRSGNVYVAGPISCQEGGPQSVLQLVKYAPNGEQLWDKRYPENNEFQMLQDAAMVIDSLGNPVITIVADDGYRAVKFDTNGDTLWTRHRSAVTGGFSGSDQMTIDQYGSTYFTGTSSPGIVTIKYLSDGTLAWVRNYDGPGGSDYARALALDSQGNLFVAVTSEVENGSDMVCIKYSSEGDELWVRRYGSLDGQFGNAAALTVDHLGNAFISGTGFITVKYTPAGVRDWVWQPGYFGATGDITVDGSGAVYLSGGGQDGTLPETGINFITCKLLSAGELVWLRQYYPPSGGNLADFSRQINVRANGEILVTGMAYHPTAAITVVKYRERDVTGDANGDNTLSISDCVYLISYIFAGGPAPNPLLAGDANCDGLISISDAVYLIAYIFGGGPSPCEM